MRDAIRVALCRRFGHQRPWFVDCDEHEVGFCWGCPRCGLVREHTGVRPIEGVPGMVTIPKAELERAIARVEGFLSAK